jgi:membrane associated rhomboid family serine protease
VFVPIFDENPLRSIRLQYITIGLIALNAAVFVLEVSGLPTEVVASFAVVPNELLKVNVWGGPAIGPNDVLAVPEGCTLLTYMFLHGDIVHLAANMLFLWVFGDNVEDSLGHMKFLLFYLVCGIAAGLAHTVMQPTSNIPLVGASGAVAGVIAAYLILHPRVRVWVLVFRFVPVRISAALALGAWILTQFVMLLLPDGGLVAWWAHVGGLMAGALLVFFMRKRGVPVFDRGLA